MTAQIPGIDPEAEDEEEIACSGTDLLLHGASFLLAPARPAQLLRTLTAAHSLDSRREAAHCACGLTHRDAEASWFRVSGGGPISFSASCPLCAQCAAQFR